MWLRTVSLAKVKSISMIYARGLRVKVALSAQKVIDLLSRWFSSMIISVAGGVS